MSAATAPNSHNSRDIRSEALVLRRVNYGEADRILDLITPDGLVAVIAKGVRRSKSKLAGGIELFCLTEITYHKSKQNGLAILTSAKMQKFYQNILQDLPKMELAAEILKKIARAAEQVDSKDFFNLTKSVFEALNENISIPLVETYFWLNFAAIRGESINFSRDIHSEKLQLRQTYGWDSSELAFVPHEKGQYSSDDIKYLRLMLSASLPLAARVKYPSAKLPNLLYIAKSLNQI